MFCIWAIRATWLVRSGRLAPFLAAVEIGRAVFELREVFYRVQGAFGTVNLLVEQSPETDRIQPEAGNVRPGVEIEMESNLPWETSPRSGREARKMGVSP